MCTNLAHHLSQKQKAALSKSPSACMPLGEGSSDCTKQQDIRGMDAGSLPEIPSENKSGWNLGAEGHAPPQTQPTTIGQRQQQILFFLPRKYEDALSSSADKYKHVSTEQRVSFGLIFFLFAELTILPFH